MQDPVNHHKILINITKANTFAQNKTFVKSDHATMENVMLTSHIMFLFSNQEKTI